MSRFSKYLFQIAFVIIAINILGLWTITFLQQRRLSEFMDQQVKVISPVIYSTDGKTVIQSADTSSISGQLETLYKKSDDLQTQIDTQGENIAALQKDVNALQKSTTTSSSVAPSTTTSGVKEYSLFIGSGSSSSLQWQDIDSAVIIVNSDNYPNISEVKFEVALSILGGNAYARLVNQANGQVIANSEVSHNTSTSTWKASSPISLNSGTTTYIVQLRSSSGEKVSMNGARIRIVTQ